MKLRFILLAMATLLAGAAQAQLKPSAAGPGIAAPKSATAPAATDAKKDPEKENAGQTAAHAWLMLLDRRDWGTAWDASSAMFRQSTPLPAWMDAIPKVRAPFGTLVEREPAQVVYKTSLANRPDGEYVSVIFRSKFDKKPNMQETVTTMREPDGRWRVTGYTFAEK